jgi:hypothetical protein
MLKFYRNLDNPENNEFKLDNDEEKLLKLLYQKTQGKLTVDDLSRQSFSEKKPQYSNILLSANISDLRDSIAIAKEQFYMKKELYKKVDPEIKITRAKTTPLEYSLKARALDEEEGAAFKKSKSESALLRRLLRSLTITINNGGR